MRLKQPKVRYFAILVMALAYCGRDGVRGAEPEDAKPVPSAPLAKEIVLPAELQLAYFEAQAAFDEIRRQPAYADAEARVRVAVAALERSCPAPHALIQDSRTKKLSCRLPEPATADPPSNSAPAR